MSRRCHGRGGPWVHAGFLVMVVIGVTVATDTGPSPAEQRQQESCRPLVWSDDFIGTERETGWDQLMAQGWTGRVGDSVDAIYPPNCEGVTP